MDRKYVFAVAYPNNIADRSMHSWVMQSTLFLIGLNKYSWNLAGTPQY